MSLERKECKVILFKQDGVVKAKYWGKKGSTDLPDYEGENKDGDVALDATAQAQADALMTLSEAAFDSDHLA